MPPWTAGEAARRRGVVAVASASPAARRQHRAAVEPCATHSVPAGKVEADRGRACSSRRGEDDLGVRVLLVLELIDLDLDVLLEKVAVAKWQRQATRRQVASRHDVRCEWGSEPRRGCRSNEPARPENTVSFSSPPCKNLSRGPYLVPRSRLTTQSTPNLCDYEPAPSGRTKRQFHRALCLAARTHQRN